jgi:hypothetical protein
MIRHKKTDSRSLLLNQASDPLITLCMHCKSLKLNKSIWVPLPGKVLDYMNPTVISHGLCPECAVQYYSQYML